MWNACQKRDRLEAALRMRGIDPECMSVGDLDRVLMRRATDRELNGIVWQLISILEPPPCHMSHCEFHGGQSAPMNCAAGKIPGRCKILKDFKKRQAARAEAKKEGAES